MDKYPSKKKIILFCMMATSIVAFKWLQFTSPIQTWSKTLTVTSCGQPDIQVSVQGKPDPCLKHKLHSLFPEDQECELICNHQIPEMYMSTKINFKGTLFIRIYNLKSKIYS